MQRRLAGDMDEDDSEEDSDGDEDEDDDMVCSSLQLI